MCNVFHVVVWNSNRVYSAMTVVMVVSLFTAITIVRLHLYVWVFLISVADIISACCLHPSLSGFVNPPDDSSLFQCKTFFLIGKRKFHYDNFNAKLADAFSDI